MSNPDVRVTLRKGVDEVLAILTGLDLEYEQDSDTFLVIARQLNRAVQDNALDQEWSYYSDVEEPGKARKGENVVYLRQTVRPRQINDDSVRLCKDGIPVQWAYFLPRDALHKYAGDPGLWCASVRDKIVFSRPFNEWEDGLDIEVPIMREPRLFDLTEDPIDENQELDFDFPNIVVMRAAYYYAQTHPLFQPRAQTLEQQMNNMKYALVERDERQTDSVILNDIILPMDSDINGGNGVWRAPAHPHARGRNY